MNPDYPLAQNPFALSKGHSWFDKLTTNELLRPISPNGLSGLNIPRFVLAALLAVSPAHARSAKAPGGEVSGCVRFDGIVGQGRLPFQGVGTFKDGKFSGMFNRIDREEAIVLYVYCPGANCAWVNASMNYSLGNSNNRFVGVSTSALPVVNGRACHSAPPA